MLLSFFEKLVREFPSVRYDFSKTIGVELSDEAGEIVVFEIIGKEIASELRRTPNNESSVVVTPRNDVVGGGIVD